MRSLTTHTVDLQYQRQELRALFTRAVKEDVERGGRYDARSTVIHVWSHPWLPHSRREISRIMGTFHCLRGKENRIYQIDIDATFSLHKMLQELCVLELKALGRVKNGRCSASPPRSIRTQHSP
jgi:hypothetical protein